MDFNFSSRSKEAILHAHKEALRFDSLDVSPEHLFLGIVKTDDQTRKVLLDLGIDVNETINKLSKSFIGQAGKAGDKNMGLSRTAEKILKIAHIEVHLLKQKLVEPYHLLLSILREPSNSVNQEFEERGITQKIRKEIENRVESGQLRSRQGFFTKWF